MTDKTSTSGHSHKKMRILA